ncbi:MAG: transporter substrate-binding domain-containing protein [Clostridia bacterium]|nr:transporter substrate-binding domain-containing protein [Clostridia bacterium]
MTKKIIALLLVAVLAFAVLSGCSKEGKASGRLAEIKERGYIIFGTEGTWSPYTFHNDNDELVGYDVDVARYVASYMGVEARFTETAWSSIFAALDGGQIDSVSNSVAYNEERAQKYDFSQPYNYTQYAILTLADNDSVQALADAKGKVSANDPTSTIGKIAEDAGVVFDEVKEAAQAISEVLNGRAEITFGTNVGFADYFKQHPEEASMFKIIMVSDPKPNAYFPVLKGNEDLVKVMNEALNKAREDGTLSSLAIKYFDVDTTKG